MNRKTFIYIIPCLLYAARTLGGTLPVPPPVNASTVEENDSTGVYDDLKTDNDTIAKTRYNLVPDSLNAMDYILEKRYKVYNDKFTRRWDDHLFLEFGGGMHFDTQTGGTDLSPLTSVNLGVGKQFNKYHSVRLNGEAGLGYLRRDKHTYARLTVTADYMFDLSSYIYGYRPSRLLDVSAFVGVGLRKKLSKDSRTAPNGKEIHLGMQMKFFSGPQGYLAIEPYAGIASKTYNYKYDSFYGANLKFIYYIHNNLSPEDRRRFMKTRPATADSTAHPEEWRTPWFGEISGGATLFKNRRATDNIQANKTAVGHRTAFYLGRWLSPAIAVKLGVSQSETTWQKTSVAMGDEDIDMPQQPDVTHRAHNINSNISAEAVVNVFGFAKHYDWQRPYGVNVILGGGFGWLMKNNYDEKTKLHSRSYHYTGAVQAWYRLSDCLQVFVEPRYTNYNYHIPYTNISGWRNFSDDVLSLNLGLTAYTRSNKYRKPKMEDDSRWMTFSAGAGAGTNFVLTRNAYEGAAMNYNANAFAEVHLGKVSGVRASFEFMSMNGINIERYTATNPATGSSYSIAGPVEHNHKRGFVSLDYLLNVSNLFGGYQGRQPFEGELFLGPTLMVSLGNSYKNGSSLVLNNGYVVNEREYDYYTKPLLGANAGVKLKFNITRHIAATLTPQMYLLYNSPQMNGVATSKMRLFETLDLGIQYDF